MAKIQRDYGYFVMPDAIIDSDLSDDAKLVYTVLARHADKAGECYPSMKRLAKMAGISVRQASDGARELEKTGWLSHKRTGRSNLYTLRTIPIGRMCRSDRQDMPNRSAEYADKGQSIEGQQKEVSAPSLKGYTQVFEDVWKIYPRKVNKQGAWKCFRTRCREGESAAFLFACTKEYAKQKAGTDEQYILHGKTFFGPDKRYLDYKPSAPAKRQAVSAPASDKRREPEVINQQEHTEVARALRELAKDLAKRKGVTVK